MLLLNITLKIKPIWLDSFILKAQEIIKQANLEHQNLSLLLCGKAKMRQLNAKYRKKDYPTDVLSWCYHSDADGEGVLGEIVICYDRLKSQAKINQWSQEIEALRLFAHGIAHILGYDHQTNKSAAKQMLLFEEELLSKIGLVGLY
ncbi:MAG: rRNA maturation RNase YbeY [SAR324 cluster bacterium]|nr:rRNA maturation RNase YbeY [SAR324 cluster bacterium]